MNKLIRCSVVFLGFTVCLQSTLYAMSAGEAGRIKTTIDKNITAYDSNQPDFEMLRQIIADIQSLKPPIQNGYSQKQWLALKDTVLNATFLNIDSNIDTSIAALEEIYAAIEVSILENLEQFLRHAAHKFLPTRQLKYQYW